MPEEKQRLSEVIFSWNFPEYIKYQKNIWWYVLSLIVLALLVWWSIAGANYLFAVFLILFYLIILVYEHRDPQTTSIAITPDGVKFGRSFYEYKMIDNFFVVYQDKSVKNLYLDFKNPLRGRLVVPIDGQDALSIREYLLQFLDEDLEREAEPISEQIRRWLRL